MNRFIAIALLAQIIWLAAPAASRAQNADEQRLLDAAKGGAGSTIQSLLEKGTSPNIKDAQGRTPLHLAVANGHQAAAETILKFGADINAVDNSQNTPLDLATAAGHSMMVEFLRGKGGKPGRAGSVVAGSSGPAVRGLKPSLKFKTVKEFEAEIREPAVLLEGTNVLFFVPKRREQEARIIFPYLLRAYDALYQMVGVHTDYRIVVYAFPKGNTNGWGGTSECSIEYDDSGLILTNQPEWTRYRVPHVSGYIEEMAHNFVHATRAQFGWEMIGWTLGAEVSQKVAGNPVLAADVRATRDGQLRTFNQYVRNGHVFPAELPANQCDRIHAWLLHESAAKYGSGFWPDFFREIRLQKQALADAASLGDGDKIRNARYQITIGCFDRLAGLGFKQLLKDNGISLATDVKSLHPESPGWNRRLTE